MGGCNQSRVVSATTSSPAGGKSLGTIRQLVMTYSFVRLWGNRRNLIQVAPAPLEDQYSVALTESTNRPTDGPPSPDPALSPPANGNGGGGGGGNPSPAFSEVSLSRYVVGEDTADCDELLELETAVRPPTPDLSIVGTPLFAKAIVSKKEQLHARQESREILRQLRDAGIVARPESRAGGLSYEYFVREEFGLLRKPPARLGKLRRAKKVGEARGDALLRQEMETAEERRKNVIDGVRLQQTEHLGKARLNSARFEQETTADAAAESLQ